VCVRTGSLERRYDWLTAEVLAQISDLMDARALTPSVAISEHPELTSEELAIKATGGIAHAGHTLLLIPV